MKNKTIVLFGLLLTVSLTSCRMTIIETTSKSADLYALFGNKVEKETISYQVLEGEDLLPFFTLKSYVSIFEKYLKENVKFEVSETTKDSTVLVKDNNNAVYYAASITPIRKVVVLNGDFSSALTIEKDYSKSSLYVGNKSDYKVVSESTGLRTFSFNGLDFTTFYKNGENYYPLSLLECVFGSYGGVHVFYNYNRFFLYSDYDELTGTTYQINGENKTAFQEMKGYIKDKMPTMPLYLRKDRKAAFLFTLENQYGLKFTRKISSMKKYLEDQSFFSDFLSESNLKRREAYYKTFALLDDGHTSIRDHNDFAWMEGEFNPYGPNMSRIISVRQALSTQRTLAPGEVYYSTDEKLAFFTFDSFTFAQNAYQSDGVTLKEDLSDYHSVNYDSFFYFVRCLNEIKTKNTVDDVIIDISTNGGGVLGMMMKLITLLSENNTSDIYVQTDLTGIVQKMTTKVDTNRDGKYNNLDVFGTDFNFYVLTSEFSFSCGNAFPFYLKKNGIAKVIGVKSGGGECAVSESYLPSGEHFTHSGHLHIGWYDGTSFEGDEAGAPVDIPVSYEDFYNLDKLQTLIK